MQPRDVWDSRKDFSQGLFVLQGKLIDQSCELLSISECNYKNSRTRIVCVANVGSNLGCALDFHTTGVMSGEIYHWYVDRYKNLIADAQYYEFNTRTYYRAWKPGVTEEQKQRFKDKMETLPCYNSTLVSKYTVAVGATVLERLGLI